MLLPLRGRRIAYDLVGPEDAPTRAHTIRARQEGTGLSPSLPPSPTSLSIALYATLERHERPGSETRLVVLPAPGSAPHC